MDPIQLFFIVPEGVSTLSCRLALRRAGGIRARLMGPDDSVLNQIEVVQRHGGAEKPDWQLLSADIPPELAGQVCSLAVQGTLDILLQPVGLAKYGAATREALFQVKIKSPWD